VPVEVITARPLNAETPRDALRATITPADSFFIRNHFDEPTLAAESYRLRITQGSAVLREFALADLERLPQEGVTCVLECSGNGRTHVVPQPEGVPWGDRAIGCATWEGPSLSQVLRSVPPSRDVVEVVFVGADHGIAANVESSFERSMPANAALRSGPILALRMNGAPLPKSHGAPLRLVVPGWYGMASVKWLIEVRYESAPFTGFFQKTEYRYDEATPVTEVRTKSLLLRPAPGEEVAEGRVTLEGRAWSGRGIREVQVQVDDGAWRRTELGPGEGPFDWRTWRFAVELTRGTHRIRARAQNTSGEWQPLDPVANRRGYGYNTADAVEVVVGIRR